MKLFPKLVIIFLSCFITNLLITPDASGINQVSSAVFYDGNDSVISINNASDFNDIRNNLSGNYELTADIDLSGYSNWLPIGTKQNPFTGTLNGNGYKITGLNINRPDMDYVGLFGNVTGLIDGEGEITNLGLINSNIIGHNYVGAIAGFHNGIMNEVYSSAHVLGNLSVGGIAGQNYYEITNVYSTGNVSGKGSVGGIIGYNVYMLKNAYYLGSVTGGEKTGSLIGDNHTLGTLSNSIYLNTYYNAVGNGSVGANVLGKTINEMSLSATYNNFDKTNIWEMSIDANYPFLVLRNTSHQEDSSNPNFTSGTGKVYNPYQITNEEELNKINDYNQSSFILKNNLKLTSFDMISNPFYGHFDGKGHIITNLFIETNNDNAGLFSYNNGIIKKLGVLSSTIKANRNVGNIVGFNDYGIIDSTFTNGEVIGSSNVGGIAGYNNIGQIIDSYNIGKIKATKNNVGGIIGNNYQGKIKNVYNIGDININEGTYLGGIAGVNEAGTITNAYHTENKGVGSGADSSTKTTLTNLLNQSGYTGFNFSSTWSIDSAKAINAGYAYLTGSSSINTESVTFIEKVVNIAVDDEYQTLTLVLPEEALNKNVTYQILSGNSYISIDSNGLVKGLSVGTSVIEVKTDDGNYTDTMVINVLPSNTSYLLDIILKDKNDNIKPFTTTFDKDLLEYSLVDVLPYDNDIISFAITKVTASQHYYIENLNNNTWTSGEDNKLELVPGPNKIEITVFSPDDTLEKVYTINVIRAINPLVAINNIEITSSSTNFDITPTFDTNYLEYQFIIGNMHNPIDLNIITNNPSAEVYINDVLGNPKTIDTSLLSLGDNLFEIKVKNGSLEQIYTINIVIEDSSAAYPKEIKIIDENEITQILNPAFDKDITEYTVDNFIDKDNEIIEVIVEKTNTNQQILITNKTTNQFGSVLNVIPGENIIEIEITSEDENDTITYQITMIREVEPSVRIKNLDITDGEGNSIDLDPIFDSNLITYNLEIEGEINTLNLNVEAEDNAASVYINGSLTNLTTLTGEDLPVGESIITIKLTKDGKEQVYTINVNRGDPTPKLITSSVYVITRDEEASEEDKLEYVTNRVPQTKIEDFIQNFDNEVEHLKVYDKNDDEITNFTSLVSTKMMLKLVINGTTYDTLIIVVKGDINGDGYANTTDISRITSETNTPGILIPIEKIAGDITEDGFTNTTDSSRISTYTNNPNIQF